jgi:hypothetical protein
MWMVVKDCQFSETRFEIWRWRLINSMKKKLISSEGKAPKSTAQQIL